MKANTIFSKIVRTNVKGNEDDEDDKKPITLYKNCHLFAYLKAEAVALTMAAPKA